MGGGEEDESPPKAKDKAATTGSWRSKKIEPFKAQFKFSTLAGHTNPGNVSFGTAPRFPVKKKELGKTSPKSQASRATSTTCSPPETAPASQEPSKVLSTAADELASPEASFMEPSVEFTQHMASTMTSFGGVSMEVSDSVELATLPTGTQTSFSSFRHPAPPKEYKLLAPRFEGSLDRLGEKMARAAFPRAKSYDPALTFGTGTCLAYQHAPHFTFGGGPSRMPESGKKKEHLAEDAPAEVAKPKPKAKKGQLAITLMDIKDATRAKTKKTRLSRGFGMEVRLSAKSSGLIVNSVPGPGKYAVPRECDEEPVWLASSGLPWGKRTDNRPSMRNPTASDVGPGEYTAHHTLQNFTLKPSPTFALPLKELSKPNWKGLDPGCYTMSSTLSKSPSYSVGPGQRPNMTSIGFSPGPAEYSIKDDICYRSMPSLSFSRSTRVHESDLVDPDEPPGPGAHWVRKDPGPLDKPSTAWPKEEDIRKPLAKPTVGPDPGHYKLKSSVALDKPITIGIPLPRPVEELPAPGQYDPEDHLLRHTAPSWGSLHRTSVRKPPWDEPEPEKEFKLMSGEKLHVTNVKNDFTPTGPKWSLQPRRPKRRNEVMKGMASDSEAMITYSSML